MTTWSDWVYLAGKPTEKTWESMGCRFSRVPSLNALHNLPLHKIHNELKTEEINWFNNNREDMPATGIEARVASSHCYTVKSRWGDLRVFIYDYNFYLLLYIFTKVY